MGKTGKWIRNFLTGKKDKEKEKDKKIMNESAEVANGHPATPLTVPSSSTTTPKEKKRWSFRRSSTSEPGQDLKSRDINGVTNPPPGQRALLLESDNDDKKHALAVAAANAAVAAAKAAAAVIQLTTAASGRATAVEEAAAIKIQSHYRGYLARKALNALRGLVKLQALVRGHLIRKQAAATLRCMQALVTAQARARAQRLWMAEESKINNNQRQFNYRKSTHENRSRHSYQDFDRGMEENVKIVEVDLGEWQGSTKGRNTYLNHGQTERIEHRISTHRASSKQERQHISPAPSAITDLSPRACSGHFEEYSFNTAQSSPPYYSAISKPDPDRGPFIYARSEYAESPFNEYPFYPSYMANTESSRAKVRSHSAPKQRPESFERQPSRRRPSIEGRNVPRSVKMQRSSSHIGSNAQNYQYPWSLKLDRSTVSLKGSECGSTSTVLTNTNYCRSLVGFEVQGNRY